jgi:Flp pilus assembly pilin Flp
MLEMLMAYVRNFAATVAKREEGQAMVEYALILSLVSIAAIAVLTPLGGAVAGALGGVLAAF